MKNEDEKNREQNSTIFKNSNNLILIGVDKKLKPWKEYVEEVFKDNKGHNKETENVGPSITKSEVYAIKKQKNRCHRIKHAHKHFPCDICFRKI